MVDYSKWAKFGQDLSDSEQEDSEFDDCDMSKLGIAGRRKIGGASSCGGPTPTVTKFETTQRVTFGSNHNGNSNDTSITVEPDNLNHNVSTVDLNQNQQQGLSTQQSQTDGNASNGPSIDSSQILKDADAEVISKWTRNGGRVEAMINVNSESSGSTSDPDIFPAYLWSQNREEVTIRFEINQDQQSNSLKPTFKTLDRWHLHIPELFSKPVKFQYEIEAIGEDDCVDWCWENRVVPIESDEPNKDNHKDSESKKFQTKKLRYLSLSVRKHTMIRGTVFWWRSVFKSHPEIKPEDIKDRSDKSLKKQKQFHDALLEATEKFKEGVKKKKMERQEIDCSNDKLGHIKYCKPATSTDIDDNQ